MADNIKGFSVKIGADTSDFIKELKKVDKEINYSEKQAKELQKQLELRFDEKTFSKAQAKVRSDLEATEQKAKAIKEQLQYLEKTGGVDTKGYKDLQVELEKATTQSMQLEEKLKNLDKIKLENAYKGVNNLSQGLETASKKTALLSAGAVGAIAGITKLAKSAVEVGDEIATLGDKYNLSSEAIQRWNYIALQSDVPTEQLYKGMTKVRDAVGSALTGTQNTATKALEALVGDISSLPTDTEEAFNFVITALAGVEDKTLQAYYANEIFGEKVATDLIPLLNQGADGLAQLGQEFEAVGYLSNEQVRALADYDNELNNFNTRITNAKTELGLALLPILDRFVTLLEENVIPAIKSLIEWFDGLSPSMQDTITNGLLLFASLSPVLLIISKLIGAIPNLAKACQFLKGHVGSLQLGVGSLLASLGLVFGLIENWGNMNNWQKILGVIGTLTTVVLGAAMAFGVFHSAWSMGLAVTGIVAGIVAATAAINSAKDNIETPKIPDFNASDYNVTSGNYNIPQNQGNYGNYNDNTTVDNSTYNIEVNLNATGDLEYDSNALAEEVIRKIIVAKQSSGR